MMRSIFCANAYSTLGYGSVDLEPHWRNISPIIGISGLFTFAWTTRVLVEMVTLHRQLIGHLIDEGTAARTARRSAASTAPLAGRQKALFARASALPVATARRPG